jgi:acetyltransferase-like isoleucine patch superfamily enzyme
MIIGDNVAIAARCVIVDTTHPLPVPGDHNVGHTLMPGDASVSIGAGTMLGAGAVVLANVTIGERCVVGANAVVTRDVPADTVVVGVPARPQRTSVH